MWKLKTNFPARGKSIILNLDNLNYENWVTVDQIIDAIVCYKCKFKKPLRPVKYNGELLGDKSGSDEDEKIYLLQHMFHLYVLYYRATEKTCYIADGMNLYLNSASIRAELSRKIRCDQTIMGIEVRPQTRVDYCGAWAALIALDFTRSHNLGQKPADLVVIPTALCRLIVDRLHKFYSAPLYPFTEWELSQEYSILCSCGTRQLPRGWPFHTGLCKLARDHAADSIVVFKKADKIRSAAKAPQKPRTHHSANAQSQ